MHPFMVDRVAFVPQRLLNAAHAVERIRGVDAIDGVHDLEAERRGGLPPIVETRPRQPQQLTLLGHAQRGMTRFDHSPALSHRAIRVFFFSHSNSTWSRPICW